MNTIRLIALALLLCLPAHAQMSGMTVVRGVTPTQNGYSSAQESYLVDGDSHMWRQACSFPAYQCAQAIRAKMEAL